MKINVKYKNTVSNQYHVGKIMLYFIPDRFLLNSKPRYLLESKTIGSGCLYNSLDEYKAHNKPL